MDATGWVRRNCRFAAKVTCPVCGKRWESKGEKPTGQGRLTCDDCLSFEEERSTTNTDNALVSRQRTKRHAAEPPIRKGDIVRFRNPMADEDPNQTYVVTAEPLGTADISPLGPEWDKWAIRPIQKVRVEDLERVQG